MDIEADDNATPNITSVGRSLAVIGSTLGIVARDLGIHNAAVNEAIKAIQLLGAVVRSLGAAQKLLAIAQDLVNVSTVEMSAQDAAAIAWGMGLTDTTVAQTAANYELATSFDVLNASMGPIGWLALAGGLVAAGVAGYGLAGGFGGAPTGPSQEFTTFYMGNVQMTTKAQINDQANAMATLYHQAKRRYGR